MYIREIKICGSFGKIPVSAMARNKYAYVYLNNSIESLSFDISVYPGVSILICNEDFSLKKVYALKTGRNVFEIKAIPADNSEEMIYEIKVFRALSTPCWTKVLENAPWCPRDSAGEIVFRDKMWLIGGYIPETVNDVWSSSNGIDWEKTGEVPSNSGVDIPVIFELKNKIYVIDVSGIMFSSDDGNDWEIVTDKAPWVGRRAMGGAVFKNKMWVMGGIKDNICYNDIWSSTDGIRWNLEKDSAPWSKRQISHSLLVFNDKLWILGGGVMGPSYFPFAAYNDVWCTDDGVNWEQVVDNAPWPARIWGSTVVYNNRMWIMGGYRSEPESAHFGDVWYSADGKDWLPFKQHANCWKNNKSNVPASVMPEMWEDRHEASAVVLNGILYFMGGMIWPLKNDIWKLEISGLCFLSQPVFEVYVDSLYEYRAYADFAKSKARYRIIEAPEWLSINEHTGKLSGISKSAGEENIIIEAFDDFGESVCQEYTLNIITLV